MRLHYLPGTAAIAPHAALAPVFWLYVVNSITVEANSWLQGYLPREPWPTA